MEYLGYNTTQTGIQPIAKKVQAIQAIAMWSMPMLTVLKAFSVSSDRARSLCLDV